MKTIFLVRHGETEANRDGFLQGWHDNPLDELGFRQAEALAVRAKHLSLKALYVSDLVRTHQTAAPLAKVKGMTPIVEPAFRELSFGKWEGVSFAKMKREAPEVLDMLFQDPVHARVGAPESFQEAQARGWQAFTKLMEQQEEGDMTMIVTHGGLIRLLICKMLEMPIEAMWRLSVANTAACRINYLPEVGYCLNYLNWQGKL